MRRETSAETADGAGVAAKARNRLRSKLQRAEPVVASSTLWSNRDYLLLMSGKTTQIIGGGMAVFAVPLIAYALTGSVLLAGLVSAIGEAGYLIATLPAGAIADRVDRKRLLLVCSVIGAVLWASLAVASALSMLTIWHLSAVLFCSAIVGSFFAPAESAGIREVVRPDQLGSAMAAMQGRSAVASMVSAPVGGLLYGISRGWPLAANAIGYIIVALCTALVRRPLNGDLSQVKGTSAMDSLREGLRFVWASPFLRTGIGIFAVINLAFGGLLIALNLHLVEIRTEPFLIGLLDAVAGGVMVFGAVIAGPLVKRFPAGWLSIVGLSVTIAAAIGLALSTEYWEYLLWIGIAVVLLPALNSGLIGYASAITPSAFQGRMNSVLSLSGVLVAPISPIVAGALLSALNVNLTMGLFAALFVFGGIVFVCFKPIRSIGRPDVWERDLLVWPRAGAISEETFR